jgi:hypothetical protein
MMATVDHYLGHDVSTDIAGLLWVVSYVGICRLVYQTIGDASPTR